MSHTPPAILLPSPLHFSAIHGTRREPRTSENTSPPPSSPQKLSFGRCVGRISLTNPPPPHHRFPAAWSICADLASHLLQYHKSYQAPSRYPAYSSELVDGKYCSSSERYPQRVRAVHSKAPQPPKALPYTPGGRRASAPASLPQRHSRFAAHSLVTLDSTKKPHSRHDEFCRWFAFPSCVMSCLRLFELDRIRHSRLTFESPNKTRPSRLSHLAPATGMGNGSDNTQQPLETTFSSSAWPGLTNGAWSSNGIGSFNRGREAAAPRGSSARKVLSRAQEQGADGFADSSNGFPNVPFGSSAFTSTSEADTWTNRAGLWNSADTTQARSLSGSTSPRSRSDASVNELNGNSTYYTSTQRAPARSKPQTALRPPSGGFGYASSFPDYPDERESVGSAEPRLGSYPVTQRSSQESSFLNAVGSGPSRDPGIPPANHAEPDIFGQTSSYAGYNYGGSTTASTHSQRPSIAGPSVAFPSANSVRYDSGGAQQMTHDEIIERLGRMGMDSDLNGASGSLSNDSPYRNGSLGFRFNPGSQSWGNEQVHQPSFARDMYPNDAGLENRASVVDRGSPAGSIYRAGGGSLNSPSFTGTPQPNPDAWSRPASRDPRMGPEVDRRGLSPPYVQQQHISYYPAPYYTQNYHGQFQQSFDPYTNIRLNGAMSGYNIPMPYPLGALGAGAVPHRPARDQDPGRGVRSVLLEEFKSSTRSNRRYELKVRIPSSGKPYLANTYSLVSGNLRPCRRVQRRPAWFSLHPAEAGNGKQ
jgi:hypothetical protein